jgi:hypothetical protein
MPKYGPQSFTGNRSPHSTGDADVCSVRTCWAGADVGGSRSCATSTEATAKAVSSSRVDRINWRCLTVENLSQVELLDGPWQTAENHSRPQTCIEEVELDVDDYEPSHIILL